MTSARMKKQATRLSKIVIEIKSLKERMDILEKERNGIYTEWANNKVSAISSKLFRFIKKKASDKRTITDMPGLFNRIKENHGNLVYVLIKFNLGDLDKYIPPDTLKPFIKTDSEPNDTYVAEPVEAENAGS